ncbi:MAG: hypothetical protein K6A30_02325 [Lachnospiraceae bacterium]|nr:hypothetical protein [Lachnospiraceae bacterium]
MSELLGPIHYWLYEKIGHQEEITKNLATYAMREHKLEDISPYVKDLPALEEVIDEENIHGWLQDRICDAEQRFSNLLDALDDEMGDVEELAYRYGRTYKLKESVAPEDAYRAFEDFFVNGMPCDRVNVITESNDSRLCFEQTEDIHKKNVRNPAVYYRVRKKVMDGMVSGTNLKVTMKDNNHYIISVL